MSAFDELIDLEKKGRALEVKSMKLYRDKEESCKKITIQDFIDVLDGSHPDWKIDFTTACFWPSGDKINIELSLEKKEQGK